MTFGQPVSYTQPKISVTYFIFTTELTQSCTCLFLFLFYWHILQLRTWDLKLVDIDLLLLDLIQVCFRLPLSRHRDKCS